MYIEYFLIAVIGFMVFVVYNGWKKNKSFDVNQDGKVDAKDISASADEVVKKVAPKKKTAAKKAPAKKAVAKKVVKKVAAKKAPAKKAVAKKAVKKTVTKKIVKKVAKKAAKKAPVATTVIAKIDAGFGNEVYIRGNSFGLAWDAGVAMENKSTDEWVWSSTAVNSEVEFKVLINDKIWSAGPNGVVFPGATVVFEPGF